MRYLKKIDDGLEFCEKASALLLFGALVVMISFNVVSRNFFQISYESILELSPVIVVWLTCVGATLALKKDRHVKMELLLRYCSAPLRLTARILVDIFGGGVMAILFFAALEFVKNETGIFGIRGWSTIIFPIFFAIASFRYFSDIVFRCREYRQADQKTGKNHATDSRYASI